MIDIYIVDYKKDKNSLNDFIKNDIIFPKVVLDNLKNDIYMAQYSFLNKKVYFFDTSLFEASKIKNMDIFKCAFLNYRNLFFINLDYFYTYKSKTAKQFLNYNQYVINEFKHIIKFITSQDIYKIFIFNTQNKFDFMNYIKSNYKINYIL